MRKKLPGAVLVFGVFGAGYLLGTVGGQSGLEAEVAAAELESIAQANQVFELRTYTSNEGKFEDLQARFRDNTMRIFEKHGMTNIGYWTPRDGPENTLIYLISHASRDQADANWRAFAQDPEWQQVAEESQRDGRLIAGLERVWLDPTDYSPMK